MKTVSTKLDKQTFEKFQEICNNESRCMSESLRKLIRMDIEAYEEGLEMEQEPSKLIDAQSRSEMKNIRISYDDGKTWYDASSKTKRV